MVFVILLSLLIILLSTLGESIEFVATTEVGFGAWILPRKHCKGGRKLIVDLNAKNVNFACFNISLLEEKYSCKIIWDLFFSINLIGTLYCSIPNTSFSTIGALIHSMKLLSSLVTLFLIKASVKTCVKYCCHFWNCTYS